MNAQCLNALATEVHALAREKGWHDSGPRNFGESMMLVACELAEAMEEFRAGHAADEVYLADDGKPEGISIELADTLIRILDTCAALGIDIAAAVEIKHEYNKTRPYRHGGKAA